MRTFFKILVFVLISPIPLMAQSSDSDEEDPFKRDPIFSKPLDEIFNRNDEGERDGQQPGAFEEERMKDYVRGLNEEGIDFGGGLEAGPYHSNPLFSQFPNLPMIHFNRVNGLFIGIKRERMQWHSYSDFLNIPGIRPHGLIGIGTASGTWEYALGLEKLIGQRNFIMVGAEFHNATATEDYWRVGLIESTLTSILASYDFPDYYNMEGFGAYTAVRSRRYFEAAFSYNIDDFTSLKRNTRFSFFGSPGIYRTNPGINPAVPEARIQRISFGAAFNPRKLVLLPNFTFSASGVAELADNSNFSNDFYYNKFSSDFQFYFNFEPGSLLKWRIKAGSITGEAPWFKQFQLGGIGSLRATPYKSISGNQMLLSNLEILFGRSVDKSNGWINANAFHITLFLDSGWAGYNEELINSNNLFNIFRGYRLKDLKHDAGIGVGSGLLRCELAWPVESSGRTPVFWVRLNPTF